MLYPTKLGLLLVSSGVYVLQFLLFIFAAKVHVQRYMSRVTWWPACPQGLYHQDQESGLCAPLLRGAMSDAGMFSAVPHTWDDHVGHAMVRMEAKLQAVSRCQAAMNSVILVLLLLLLAAVLLNVYYRA